MIYRLSKSIFRPLTLFSATDTTPLDVYLLKTHFFNSFRLTFSIIYGIIDSFFFLSIMSNPHHTPEHPPLLTLSQSAFERRVALYASMFKELHRMTPSQAHHYALSVVLESSTPEADSQSFDPILSSTHIDPIRARLESRRIAHQHDIHPSPPRFQ